LVAEQRVLKYTKGGFTKYEWHKSRIEANEAFDLRCYARAGLEYLRVRLEQMTRDELKGVNPRAIEQVETADGASVLNYSKKNEPKRAGDAKQAPTQMGGAIESEPAAEPERPMVYGSALESMARRREQGGRFGSVGSAF
jgi:phage terminase large subunit GpA-like protein